MFAAIGALTLISLVGHIVLIILLCQRHRVLRLPLVWAVLPLLVTLSILIPLLIPLETIPGGPAGVGLILTLASSGYVAAYGLSALRDVNGHRGRLWLLALVGWQVALLVALVTGPAPAAGRAGWLGNLLVTPSAAPLITVVGFTIVSALLLTAIGRAFVQARLPETANRNLLWFLAAGPALMSVLFLMSGSPLLMLLGLLLLTGANIALAYLMLATRLLDLRRQFGGVARSLALMSVSTVVILGVFGLAEKVNPDATDATLFIAVLALVTATVVSAVELGIRLFARKSLAARENDLAQTAEAYSRELTSATDMTALAAAAVACTQQTMTSTSASLLRVTPSARGGVALTAADGASVGQLADGSPLYRQLSASNVVSSYDMTDDAAFTELDERERAIFDSLKLRLLAPILAEGKLLGILAAGPRQDDAAYSAEDARRLALLANLTAPTMRQLASRETITALTTRLGQTAAQMKALNAAKTDFVAIAGHELRTPIAQISGNLELLDVLNMAEALDTAQTAEIVAAMRSASERLETLAATMLDMVQIDTGELALNTATVSIEDVVRETVEPLANAVRQRRIGISVNDLRDLPPVQADTIRLTQALRHLLLNAVKFTPDGGRIEISGEVEAGGNALVLAVKDSGIGIEAAHLDVIFEKFYRAHPADTHSSGEVKFMGGGPGLGLPIARGIIERHGGQVWAESTGYDPDNAPGTTFFVRLPLATTRSESPQPPVAVIKAASPLGR
jgi:signal transduction histidine kinase